MEHIVRFEHGHDCIRFECRFGSKNCHPGAGGSHGIHGLTIRFISKDADGAVQFALCTGWLPQKVARSKFGSRYVRAYGKGIGALPADLGYHSKKPRYDGQEPIAAACEFCDGQPCYYDGSGLNAHDAMYALVNGGEAALWTFLDAYYDRVFRGGAYPEPAEYATPLRKG